jgi:hypothetical protein
MRKLDPLETKVLVALIIFIPTLFWVMAGPVSRWEQADRLRGRIEFAATYINLGDHVTCPGGLKGVVTDDNWAGKSFAARWQGCVYPCKVRIDRGPDANPRFEEVPFSSSELSK